MHDFEQITDHAVENFGPVHVETTVAQLVALFGEPNSTDDEYKVDVAWDLRCPLGAVHIYNYKNGPNYLGEDVTVADIDSVSIQGENEPAVRAAAALIRGA